MAEGIIDSVNLFADGTGTRFGNIIRSGQADIRFDEEDLIDAEYSADLKGKRVSFNDGSKDVAIYDPTASLGPGPNTYRVQRATNVRLT